MNTQGHVWHKEVITPAVEQVLGLLGSEEATRSFYLAGGTALALHFGHRRSADLDFFTPRPFDQDRLLNALQSQIRLFVVNRDRETLHLHIGGVKVRFLGYVYPVLLPFRVLSGIDIADPKDIACMKISAIAGRGTRRDFVDVYLAAQQYGLEELLDLFQKKYAAANYNLVHLLKSLIYFTDAEREPLPDLLVPLTWSEVTRFCQHEVSRLSQP